MSSPPKMSTNKLIFCTVAVVCLLLLPAIESRKKHRTSQASVKVSLYYESLCPFCRDFIKNQLYPGYLKLNHSVILDLIPFGKATQINDNGKWIFTCQHGHQECFGNKVQACVLASRDLHLKKAQKTDFVGCIMSSDDPASPANVQLCATANKISWTSLGDCFSGVKGDELLAQYGQRTEALVPKLSYVPYILFNGVFNQTLNDDARDDFVKTVCGVLKTKPVVCQ